MLVLGHLTEGTHRLDEPVSKITLNVWPGVPLQWDWSMLRRDGKQRQVELSRSFSASTIKIRGGALVARRGLRRQQRRGTRHVHGRRLPSRLGRTYIWISPKYWASMKLLWSQGQWW